MLYSEVFEWITTSPWYFGSPHPLYFDMLCQDSKFHRFKLIVEPDLSDASLHVINTSQLTLREHDYANFQSLRICEDTLVSLWDSSNDCRVYSGLTSAHFTADDFSQWIKGSNYSLCPASGRFVCSGYGDENAGRILVADLI